VTLRDLYAEADRAAGSEPAKVTFIALSAGGWKAVVSGIELPPHIGQGRTAVDAFAEVMRFARRIGAVVR
jgi:hypothetical protein